MLLAEITDDLIEAIKSEKYDFIHCNFPNGNMVGHTGNMSVVITSVEAVDYGNADEMNKKGRAAGLYCSFPESGSFYHLR